MKTLYVTQVKYVYLKGAAADMLTKRAHDKVTEWLKQWTCPANFKAVITNTEEEGLEFLKGKLRETLVPSFLTRDGVKPEHFEFEVSSQEAKNGEFWMPSALVKCTRHQL